MHLPVSVILAALLPLSYNNDISVELGVGLWGIPVPVDYDGDSLTDLIVSCPDTPYRGTYFFRNIGTKDEPFFDKAVKLNDKSHHNLRFSEYAGKSYLMTPGELQLDFFENPFNNKEKIQYSGEVLGSGYGRCRSNMWNKTDWDGDGDMDIIVGIDTWDDYGWDNAFNSKGEWTRGPLHGYVYLLENVRGHYRNRGKLTAGGGIIDTFGAPCPCVADFDGDGDLDLICGEFRDALTWYENVGTREHPLFKTGRILRNSSGEFRFHIQMIVPVAADFDGDSLPDLIVGDEDGTVVYLRNTGRTSDGMPQFADAVKFRQRADLLKFGALCTPWSCDWNGDGLEDIVCGNSAGELSFIENLGFCENGTPRWAEPRLFTVDNDPVRIMAGLNGSVQGPAELKWGYTVPCVADWDGDGLPDIIVNSIWGRPLWFRGHSTLSLDPPRPLRLEGGSPKLEWNWWTPEPGTLVSQWRTTPVALDWNKDGLCDLVMLDSEGYLAYYERGVDPKGEMVLRQGRRIFHCVNGCVYSNKLGMTDSESGLLRLNAKEAGGSGRRKICLTDWDGDGLTDLIVDGRNVVLFRCVRIDESGDVWFEFKGDLALEKLEGHSCAPTPVRWRDKSGLLIGGEDGHFYFLENMCIFAR